MPDKMTPRDLKNRYITSLQLFAIVLAYFLYGIWEAVAAVLVATVVGLAFSKIFLKQKSYRLQVLILPALVTMLVSAFVYVTIWPFIVVY